ncbi:MAG TPA: hydantoinase B/oxoprolinase family protein [Dehalococcoidia bacterium]|nr:hydantoinase B/oxoprolinase family protein [Dehalococcoidia bacterium]
MRQQRTQTVEQQFDPITLEVLWNRLIAIVDEAAVGLVRTSFSTVVRESNDFACVLTDREGNSVAQSSLSVPSFLGTIPITVKHFLRKFPVETLRPGDVIVTNNPWLASGHLPDTTIAMPIFHRDEVTGFAAVTSHKPDIGGRVRSADATELYEEGLHIPPMKLYRAGEPNETLLELLQTNVRIPEQVIGDLMADVTTARSMGGRLLGLLDEYHLPGLTDLARTVQDRSEAAMRASILAVPDGDYQDEAGLDGFDEPIRIRLKVSVRGDSIHLDYTGSSPQVARSLNSVHNYTYAYSVFPLKALLNAEIPNNQGCFKPFSVYAPQGTILNPRPPAPVGGRVLVGHALHAVIFGALAGVLPDRAQADSSGPLWSFHFTGEAEDGVAAGSASLSGSDGQTGTPRAGSRYAFLSFVNGGKGASVQGDGLDVTAFPGNISNTPVEIIEVSGPVLIEEKALRVGSGGPGRFRGGCGQELTVRLAGSKEARAVFLVERTAHPPRGRLGGGSGAPGRITVNGEPTHPKLPVVLRPGDRVRIELPGGGGVGDPKERDRDLVRRDVAWGLVSADEAREVYGL